jgi:hypothetical protein
MDVLEPDGTRRTNLICPQCRQRIQVVLFDEGVVVIVGGRAPQHPEPSRPLVRPVIRSYDERQPNPWQTVAAFLAQRSQRVDMSDAERSHVEMATRLCKFGFGRNVPPEDAFSVIGSILLAHGFTKNSCRFFRLWDTIACSACNSRLLAARGWWGCVM